MKYPMYINLCGFGGQGIVLAAEVIGKTVVTKGNLYAVQTQSYGSEARGGQCQSELIISDKKINSPVSQKNDILISLFQTAYDTYISNLKDDGILVIDPDLVTKLSKKIKNTFEVPATKLALGLGNKIVANMVILGFLSESTGIIDRDSLVDVVRETLSQKFFEIDKKAIDTGVKYARDHNMYIE